MFNITPIVGSILSLYPILLLDSSYSKRGKFIKAVLFSLKTALNKVPA